MTTQRERLPEAVTNRLKQAQRNRKPNRVAVRLLQSWIDGDAEEQRETGAYLKQVLDEDRLSDRKLFP